MSEHRIELTVNGRRHGAMVEARTSLGEFLREGLGYTGTHLACEHGVCGACTVMVEGKAVRSCLMLAVQAEGCDVTTVEGLAGEEIPIEARIMAIADVYDALVSKRVYKESMSFEQADSIIMEGMGTQFDKGLEPYYLRARPKLEAYYDGLGAQAR